MYSKETLKQAGKDLDLTGGYHEGEVVTFAWVVSGRGEVQVSEDGEGWWFRWDRTHAVADEEELSPPEVTDGEVLAEWMFQEAKRFRNR